MIYRVDLDWNFFFLLRIVEMTNNFLFVSFFFFPFVFVSVIRPFDDDDDDDDDYSRLVT